MHRHQAPVDDDHFWFEDNDWLFKRPQTDWKEGRRYHDKFGDMFDHTQCNVEYDDDDFHEGTWVWDQHLHKLVLKHRWISRDRSYTTTFYTGPEYFNKKLIDTPVYDHIILREISGATK